MSCVHAERAGPRCITADESRSLTAESATNAAILLADKDLSVLFLRHESDEDAGSVRASCP